MRRVFAAATVVFALLLGRHAVAHRVDEYLQATIVSVYANRVEASMRLIPGVRVAASVINQIDSDGDGALSENEEHAFALQVLNDVSIVSDGKSVRGRLTEWKFPSLEEMREGIGEIQLQYVAELPQAGPSRTLIFTNLHPHTSSVYLINAAVPKESGLQITAQKRNERQSVYELDYQQSAGLSNNVALIRTEHTFNRPQFLSLFDLGMRHIAEGNDHLLFLLTLLLPAPLLVVGSRWGPPAAGRRTLLRIVGIVTAFTLGHSITLSLAALGAVHLPARPVEILIALSVLVSAVHAYRPLFFGREQWLAATFGLVHGLAFAAVLEQLELEHWARISGILAFNLGIECMQLIVIAIVLPSLMLMSQTRAYPLLRTGGAAFAATAAASWMLERLFALDIHTDSIVNAIARHALSIAIVAFLASLALRFSPAVARLLPAKH